MFVNFQTLTGGILLQRNKYYIVIYRGKDFLPTSVATALAERQELTKDIQEVEERARGIVTDVYVSQSTDIKGHAPVGTLEEFQEAQARWGREISAEEREEMKKEASKSLVIKFVKKIEHKLSLVSFHFPKPSNLLFCITIKNKSMCKCAMQLPMRNLIMSNSSDLYLVQESRITLI